MAEGNVIHVKTIEEYNATLQAAENKLVVVDFSATWCGPCRMIAPKFAEMSKKYTNVVFVHVDVDELNTLPDVADVSGVPTFKYFKNGSKVLQFSGANAGKIEDNIISNA